MRFYFCIALVFCALNSQSQSLDHYLDIGLKNSPLLKEYNLQLQSALIDSLKVLAGYKPQVGVSSNIMYPTAIWKFAYDSAITDGGHYSALVGVNQPLFNKRFIKAKMESVALQKLTSLNNQKISETELKEAITSQYLEAFALQSKVEFEKSIIRLLNEEKSTLKMLVDKGIYNQIDYLNLIVSISSREIEGKQFVMDLKNNIAMLNLICGIHDTTSVNLIKPEISRRTSFDPASSPLMMQFRLDSLKNSNEKLLIDQQYLPRISAFADAGINAISPQRLPYSLGASFGLNFSMPLYDGKQKQMDQNKIDLVEQSRKNYKSTYQDLFLQRQDQLKQQLELNDELMKDISDQIINLEKLLTVYKTEINKGLIRWMDYLDIVHNYEETKNKLTEAQITRLTIITQLNYLK